MAQANRLDEKDKDLLPFVIQCTCDWFEKVSDPDCLVHDGSAECVTCDSMAIYNAPVGLLCHRCFVAPGPSWAELAIMEESD